MSGVALGLVLASAVAHALWNLLAKRADDRLLFFWLMNVVVGVLGLPAVLHTLAQRPLSAVGWLFVTGTGLLHVAYFWSLARGYTHGDMSVVYPVARGTGPLLVALLAPVVFREVPSGQGAAGIALILLGIYASHLQNLSAMQVGAPLRTVLEHRGSRYALLTGLTIAAYTLWDRGGVAHVEPLLYGYFVFAIPALLIAPFLWRAGAATIARSRPLWPRAAAAAGLSYAAYALVLTAFTLSKVSYVAAAREVGIVVGAALGSAFLKEKHGPPRLLGSALIFVGVALIAAAK